MDPDGSHARQITHLATEAGGILVTHDGKRIIFGSAVYPACGVDDSCREPLLDRDSKPHPRVMTSLLYRHWNAWEGDRRQHLLIVNVDGTQVRDLTPGQFNVPPFSLGGPDDYALSPDSAELAFTMNVDENQATSTNSDIYTIPLDASGPDSGPRKITLSPGGDNAPQYSPDGKYLAFRSQLRAGYESDRWRLMVLDRVTGRTISLTDGLDRWVDSFTWSPDSTRLFFTVEDRGRTGLQMIQATGGGSATSSRAM